MPVSVSIYGSDWNRWIDAGLAPEQYRWRFLAEGDSWMERSSALTPSLPDHLADAMERAGENVLIVNLARFGDTMRRMGELVQGEFAGWVNTLAFDAILLSAGGNDFIDAARDTPPGTGLLRDMRGQPLPTQGRDCVRPDALAALVTQWLDPNFAALHQAVRTSRHNGATPIFLNSYDTPVARDAPAPPGTKAWLFEAYRKNGIAPALWPDLTDAVFNDLQTSIADWAKRHDGVHLVPTDGVLTAADPAERGDSGDWINEIHPNAAGWRKLAPIWQRCILDVLTRRQPPAVADGS